MQDCLSFWKTLLVWSIIIISWNCTANAQSGNNTSPSSAGATSSGSSSANVGANILSYQAQDEIGQYMASNIIAHLGSHGLPKINNIYITTTAPNAAGTMLLYRGVMSELRAFENGFQSAIADYNSRSAAPKPSTEKFMGTTLSDATNVMSVLSQAVALSSTSTTMASVPVNTNELAVIPGAVRTFNALGATCQFVDLFVNTDYVTNTNSLFSCLLTTSSNWGMSQVIVNQRVAVSNGLVQMTNVPVGATNDIAILMALNGAYGMFISNVLTTNLNSLLVSDFYECNVHNHPHNYLLFVRALYAGGDNRIKSNPLWNLFRDGPRFSYLGGGAAAYFVFDSNGNIVVSDALRNYDGFWKLPGNCIFCTPKIESNLKPK